MQENTKKQFSTLNAQARIVWNFVLLWRELRKIVCFCQKKWYNISMENIREIISSNIVALRKNSNMTQMDLSKKINYSDKAVSRWEKGEVLPDVETLQQLSKIFGVSLTYMFERHDDVKTPERKKSLHNELALHMLACCALWVVLTILFVYVEIFYNYVFWQAFVWGLPFTFAMTLRMYKKQKNEKTKLILKTGLNWSLLVSIYLQLLKFNLWLIFIIGIPIQLYIIVSYFSPENIKLFTRRNKKE